MKYRRTPFFELSAGIIVVAIGFILWWWSTQLVWIQIYPQPYAKSLIEIAPSIFWIIGAFLIIDSFRRTLKNK